MEPVIRLLLVEDDPDWRRGLEAFLGRHDDLRLVRAAETAEAALQVFEEEEIDIVLMDIMLGASAEGIWLTAEVTERWEAKVIMLTSLEDKEMIVSAFQAGAVDYVLKSDYDNLPDTIRSVQANRAPISPQAASQMREEFKRLKRLEREMKTMELKQLLTPTELEILKGIHAGQTQTAIAETMVVSIRTIKVHVGNILRKLGAASSKEAAQTVHEHGLI